MLIEPSAENQDSVRKSLQILHDKSIDQMKTDDLEKYTVVKPADEVVIDLLIKAGSFEFRNICKYIVSNEIQGVKIPFANAEPLYAMKKNTLREKDKMDLLFPEEILKKNTFQDNIVTIYIPIRLLFFIIPCITNLKEVKLYIICTKL